MGSDRPNKWWGASSTVQAWSIQNWQKEDTDWPWRERDRHHSIPRLDRETWWPPECLEYWVHHSSSRRVRTYQEKWNIHKQENLSIIYQDKDEKWTQTRIESVEQPSKCIYVQQHFMNCFGCNTSPRRLTHGWIIWQWLKIMFKASLWESLMREGFKNSSE